MALFRHEGRVYAVSNRCPHQGGPLSDSALDGGEVVCPLHGWRFDLKTGHSTQWPDVIKIQTFAVEEREGQIFMCS